MNADLDRYIAFAECTLTAHRFQHSYGVMQVMSELAPLYGLDKSMAMAAGILHDIAKEFSPEALIRWAKEHRIPLRTEYDKYPLYLHGPVGAGYVAQELDVADLILLEAISQHSYFNDGGAISPIFCWCLRFSDMLEPLRDWDDLRCQLQPLVYAGKMGEGAHALMQWVIPFHESASLPVHPNIRRLERELSILKNEDKLENLHALPV